VEKDDGHRIAYITHEHLTEPGVVDVELLAEEVEHRHPSAGKIF